MLVTESVVPSISVSDACGTARTCGASERCAPTALAPTRAAAVPASATAQTSAEPAFLRFMRSPSISSPPAAGHAGGRRPTFAHPRDLVKSDGRRIGRPEARRDLLHRLEHHAVVAGDVLDQ